MTTSVMAAALNAQVVTMSSLLALDLIPTHFKGLSLHVAFMLIPMLYNAKRDVHGDILEKLAAIIDAGELKPLGRVGLWLCRSRCRLCASVQQVRIGKAVVAV